MYSKIIRVLFYILFFAVPLAMNSSTSELFEFNKMMFIYGVTALVAAFWATELIIYKKRFIHNKWLSIGVSAFLISQLLSTVFSIDVHTSIFGYYGRFNGGLLSIISYIFLLYAFINHFDRESIVKLLKLSCLSSVIVILWGIPGRFGYDMSCYVFSGQFTNACWTDQFRPAERMFSTLGQPNWLGAYLAIHFFIGMYFLLNSAFGIMNARVKERLYAVMWFLYTMSVSAAIIFTKSRSALVSVFAGIGLLPVLWMLLLRKERKNFIKLYIPVLLVLIIPVLYYKTGITVIDRYITLSTYTSPPQGKESAPQPHPAKAANPAGEVSFNTDITDSLVIRKIVWQGATELGKRYPLFGTGVETFAYAYYFVRPQIHNLTSEWDYLYNKAHNEYLNYFATTGYTGIILYTLMILMVFVIGGKVVYDDIIVRRHEKADSEYYSRYEFTLPLFLMLSYVTILFTNFLGFSTTSINLFFYLIPAMLVVLDLKPMHLTREKRTMRPAYLPKVLVGTVMLAAGYAVVFVVNYLYADIKYATADKYSRSGDYQSAATLMQEALEMHYEHVYEDKLSYYLANLSYAAAYQKEKETAKQLLSLSDFYNRHSIQASPRNMLYWKTLVKNHYLYYQITLDPKFLDSGLQGLITAAEIAPTDSKIPYSIALFYSLMEDEEKDESRKAQLHAKAIDAIDHAISLKPDYRDSYYLKGQLQKKFGDRAGARETFEYILTTFNADDAEVKKELDEL